MGAVIDTAMTLPDLATQAVYARCAWGVVLAAVVVALVRTRVPAMLRTPMHAGSTTARLLLLVAACLAVMWLPGAASPAYWLGLGFQSPSALLLALCAVALVRRVAAPSVAPTPLLGTVPAAVLAVLGAALYADAVGWLAWGLYAVGFAPLAGPAATVTMALLAALWVATGRQRDTGIALLAAAAVFAFWRLPSGNPFDMLIDPLLWGWALVALWRRQRVVRAAAASASGIASVRATGIIVAPRAAVPAQAPEFRTSEN
jgi:hypothetical protein